MDDLIQKYIDKLYGIADVDNYDKLVCELKRELSQGNYSSDILKAVQIKSKYIVNKFSDESTTESMEKSKDGLTSYLESLADLEIKRENTCLTTYLENFYAFLDAFRNRCPDARASLKAEALQNIQVNNEYDLQHILYAALKPLFPDARTEINHDTGIGTVRSDICISSVSAVVEAKCSRASMTEKKLIEEIEADIVHYHAEHIYFYIYDKVKIVKNPQVFKMGFNREFDGKQIHVILIQPISL